MIDKLVCILRGHVERISNCPYTLYTYITCNRCEKRLDMYKTDEK